MPRTHEELKVKYEKIRERAYRDVDRARIDNDPEAIFQAAEALSSNIIHAVMQFEEDQGWNVLGGITPSEEVKGIAYNQLVNVIKKSEEMTKTNALMGHALRVKTNHFSGRGFTFDIKPAGSKGNVAPRFQKMIDDTENQRVIFSTTAMKNLNRILWNTGNLFALWNEKEKEFTLLSVDGSLDGDFIAYDDNPSRIKYYKRSYSIQNDLDANGKPRRVEEWIPVLEHKEKVGAKLPKTIKVGGQDDQKVSQDSVIIDLRVNKDEDDAWGVPDCFSAIPWAWASAEYIKDGSKLLKAYAAIAYQIKTKTEAGKKAAGAAIATGKIGGSAVTGVDTEISQVNKASAVDLYTGRPIQAMFASAVDLSVTSVTNDTGKGGAYGSEQVLTTPELMAALSRQEELGGFYARCFRAMGVAASVKFSQLQSDPSHRVSQGLTLGYTSGAFSQLEYRTKMLALYDVEGNPEELPEPNAFTGSKVSTLTDDAVDDVNSGQGKSGAVGALAEGDNELRDEE